MTANDHVKLLEDKITSRKAQLGVIGLGYVGLPLAVEFAKVGFQVTGIDLDRRKVKGVNAGTSRVEDIADATLAPLVRAKKIRATTSFEVFEQGSLMLDVSAVATRSVVWRGVAQAEVDRQRSAAARGWDIGKQLTQPSADCAGWPEGNREKHRRSKIHACMLSYSFYHHDNRVMRYAEALAKRGDDVDDLAEGKGAARV